MTLRASFPILAVFAVFSLCFAQVNQEQESPTPADTHAAHVLFTPDQMNWGPAPPGLPAGAQVAVLRGDPSKAGAPFTFRAKLPDGYRVPPHWHPTDENVVVIKGTLFMGMGEKFDQSAAREMPAGSYSLMPAGTRHFVWAKGETIIEVYGTGPFGISYVNDSDDPRKQASK